jgi:hypothetical protein
MNIAHTERRTIAVFDPTAEDTTLQDKLANRLVTLDRKVVALLDNSKDLVDVLLGEVKNLIKKDFPDAEFRYFHKDSVSGARPELMKQVMECDAVITAVGD